MKLRYIAAMARRCGGYRRQISERYVSLIIDLLKGQDDESIECYEGTYQADCNCASDTMS